MKVVLIILAAAAALAVFYVAAIMLLGRRIFAVTVKRSYKVKPLKDDAYGEYKRRGLTLMKSLPADEYTVYSDDGLKLHGSYLHNPKGGKGRLLVGIHGFRNSGYGEVAGQCEYWLNRGFDIFVMDNRAHGKSEGRYIGFGTLDACDLKIWLRFITAEFPGQRVWLLGVSMGCTTALNACDDLPDNVEGIVADCGFTSVEAQINNVLRHVPLIRAPAVKFASHMCRRRAGYGFGDENTRRHVSESEVPIMFIHGGADFYVPTYMSKQNYAACGARKALLIVPGAAHPRSHFVDSELYERSVDEFFGFKEQSNE